MDDAEKRKRKSEFEELLRKSEFEELLNNSTSRITGLAYEVLEENGAVTDDDSPFPVEFDNEKLITFRNSKLECPILVFKSFEELFKTKTCEDAKIKATKMSDGKIKNLIRNKLVQEIKSALHEDNWLDKVLTKITSSGDTPEEKTKRIKKTFKTVEDFQTFIRRNDPDGPVLLEQYIKSEPISEAYICPMDPNEHRSMVIARIGEHVFHAYNNGMPVGREGKKSHTVLAGRTLEEAVKDNFILDLIEAEKSEENWEKAHVRARHSFVDESSYNDEFIYVD